MTESHNEDASAHEQDHVKENEVRYPENRIVGLLDTPEQLESAVRALTSGGFLTSEIEVIHGAAAAEKLHANTGRKGLTDLAMRFSEFIGVPNDEVTIKNQYADGLKNGQLLLTVFAPTDERQQAASRILEEHGATKVKFLGRYTISWPAPPA
jgi:hypothetical protein